VTSSRHVLRTRTAPGLLLLAPSLIVVGVFVYGMLAWTARVSTTDRHSMSGSSGFVGLDNYATLFTDDPNGRFWHSVGNLGLFLVVFLIGTMLMGFLWALALDRGVRGEPIFRSIFIFPIAISFIASGIVWRWLLNGSTGDEAGGINRLLGGLGLGFLQNSWFLDPTWGMASIAVPAIWQLSGYVMALFLAGFRGIPDDQREAATMDGATTWQMYRHVLFPQLSPAALSALIIVGHIGVKVFDLIMSMTGSGYITEVPAVYIWNTLLTSDYAKASAIATVLLVAVAVVVVPYLVYTVRREKQVSP
jgi:glucose/mannose transport system permease protein